MFGLTTFELDQKLLDLSLGIAAQPLPPAPWIALCTTLPTKTVAGVEVTAASYVRLRAVFQRPPTLNVAYNRDALEWPQAKEDWGAVVGLELWTSNDSAAAGTRFYFTPLVDPLGNPIVQSVLIGDVVTIGAGVLAVGGA